MRKILFIYEKKNWSIYDDGYNLKKHNQNIILSKLPIPIFFYIKIIHFGSFNLLRKYKFLLRILKLFKFKIICSWYHIDDSKDKNFYNFHDSYNYVDKWHVTTDEIYSHLLKENVVKNKIKKIFLGFESKLFYPPDISQIIDLKNKLDLPKINNTIIIGSFQKDGSGWNGGDLIKQIKRPQLFINFVKQLKKTNYDIFVVLAGPSRNFVINELKKNQIKYKYFGYVSQEKLSQLFKVIDYYFITSIKEGGPKSLIEATASNKKVISTNVGMSGYVLKKYLNGVIINEDEFENFCDIFSKFHKTKINVDYKSFKKEFDWESISNKYKELLYDL